ncbi:tRNA (adenosine(37)-N6)-threonylcarbamoyltransferase complex dimerization subunit type 1 TsaB [Gordonia spumicola]|uniref:tRNA (Adenosine(37)-N6)-threonylcarbamoyltransferase complex dimerization subunit type 1 TsaB n=1 Tax=Gordonia spumicola TaxID=589161 RepID=A0A7I9V912_9ACTN|nr:tRNA (adenosine(37)-N6)-threonylcarbamoyltransferase complex dimerization subunit type 1 TsaB [Gordonia spumicola]GEE01878.1 tRNA (adenosine(37)-N6)-threonylcarbamoyltransferase complex dimerization subunit type 1 TsaB [Gordonia spumicola]
MSLVLAIDTATEAVVTGVVRVDDGHVTTLAERSIDDNRRHAEILTTLVREVLDEAGIVGSDLNRVVVGVGPGPFTGLRVGMATAAAYGDALGLPVHGVCTLDAIAIDADLDGESLVVTDARRREVYWARYRDGERVDGPGVVAPASLQAGDAVVVSPARFADAVGGSAHLERTAPTASGLVTAWLNDRKVAEPLEPLYLRRPDAVELKDQRRKSLLPVTPA